MENAGSRVGGDLGEEEMRMKPQRLDPGLVTKAATGTGIGRETARVGLATKLGMEPGRGPDWGWAQGARRSMSQSAESPSRR